MTAMEQLFLILELVGTLAFAASGAITGLKKNMDVFGVCILGLTTAVGGGVIRDLLLGITPPGTFQDPIYAVVALLTSLVLFLPRIRRLLMWDQRLYDLVLLIMDSAGLGIFTVAGIRIAYEHAARPTLFLLVFVGVVTGVGGGVIVNGDVVSGVVGAGGEIGHMCLNPAEERTCGCGGHGHLEQYSSATGVVSNYLAECKKAGVEPIELTGPSDSKDVFQACREGDKLALAAADTMADYLGRALALIANVVDPEMFLIGGGASASADVYLDKVRERFKQYALSASRETPIKVASLGNDAGIIGAAYVALRAAGK